MLTTRIEHGEHEVSVLVEGDVDLETAPVLARALRSAAETGASIVACDVSEVGFVDSSGLTVLIDAFEELRITAQRLVIVRPSPSVARLLEITGLDYVFNEERPSPLAGAPTEPTPPAPADGSGPGATPVI